MINFHLIVMIYLLRHCNHYHYYHYYFNIPQYLNSHHQKHTEVFYHYLDLHYYCFYFCYLHWRYFHSNLYLMNLKAPVWNLFSLLNFLLNDLLHIYHLNLSLKQSLEIFIKILSFFPHFLIDLTHIKNFYWIIKLQNY